MDEGRHPAAVVRLVQELCKLPGIGPKSAERLAFFLLAGDRRTAIELSDALRTVVTNVRSCEECGNYAEASRCPICSDSRRDESVICVVESPRDLAAFERAGSFRGRYHVLGGRLAPLDNVGPDQLTVGQLVRRVRSGAVNEVILATSPTLEGDGTALYVSNLLAGTGVRMSRLARGLPSGASLELANTQMLSDALEGRRAY